MRIRRLRPGEDLQLCGLILTLSSYLSLIYLGLIRDVSFYSRNSHDDSSSATAALLGLHAQDFAGKIKSLVAAMRTESRG